MTLLAAATALRYQPVRLLKPVAESAPAQRERHRLGQHGQGGLRPRLPQGVPRRLGHPDLANLPGNLQVVNLHMLESGRLFRKFRLQPLGLGSCANP